MSEAEVAQFYEQNKQRAQGRTLDDLRAQIKAYPRIAAQTAARASSSKS